MRFPVPPAPPRRDMAFTLYSLLQASLLIVNAVAVLHEERFLRHGELGRPHGLGRDGRGPAAAPCRWEQRRAGRGLGFGVAWGMNSQPLPSYLVSLSSPPPPIIVLFSCPFLTVSRSFMPRLGVFGVVQRFFFPLSSLVLDEMAPLGPWDSQGWASLPFERSQSPAK